jgi:hypothetical protein
MDEMDPFGEQNFSYGVRVDASVEVCHLVVEYLTFFQSISADLSEKTCDNCVRHLFQTVQHCNPSY